MPVLTATWRAFREAFPTVGVRLYSGVMWAVVDLVLRAQVDRAIAGSTLVRHDALVARPIGGHRIGPIAAPGHPLAQAAGPVPLAALREHCQIVVTDLSGHTRGRDFHVHAFDVWRVTDAATKRALILDGLGWGGLASWQVADDLATGRLVEQIPSGRSEEHTSELQSLMRISYAVFCLNTKESQHTFTNLSLQLNYHTPL